MVLDKRAVKRPRKILRWAWPLATLTLLEREVGVLTGPLPIERWLADLDRIEQAAARIRTPVSHASEAYTLREHIGLVRRMVLAKASDRSLSPWKPAGVRSFLAGWRCDRVQAIRAMAPTVRTDR